MLGIIFLKRLRKEQPRSENLIISISKSQSPYENMYVRKTTGCEFRNSKQASS